MDVRLVGLVEVAPSENRRDLDPDVTRLHLVSPASSRVAQATHRAAGA
jgi:hypothetical protein